MAKIGPQDLQTLKLLLKEQVITKDLYEGALHKLEAYGGYVDEVILDISAADEKTLLSTIAAHYETKFVTSEKLKQATFDEKILNLIPVEMAKQFTVFPIAFDEKTKTLTVVTPNINDINAITEIERRAGARKVKTYAARTEAVKLSIRRWYDKDLNAFQTLDAEDIQQYHQLLDVYEQQIIDEKRKSGPPVDAGTGKAIFDEEHFKRSSSPEAAPKRPTLRFSEEDYLATLQIMLGLIERERRDLKGHSVHVSRYIKQIGERIRLPQTETDAYAIAGVLHDMGKSGMYHLTTLNCSQYEGHRDSALKRFIIPTKMFENVALPKQTCSALDAMYERYDGRGFPKALVEKEIPLGARILAVADSFSDLVMNPRNPYRRKLTGEEAIGVIEKHKGDIFDPIIVDALKATVAGDKLRTSILSGQNSILIIDSDTEQGTILDLNLANKGFNVEVLTNSKTALEKVQAGKFDLIVSEVNLEPLDGFELLTEIRSNDKIKNIPVMFYTTRSSTNDVDKGFTLGAADYVVKPSSVELLIAKIMKITKESVEKAAAPREGVSGSLKEMDLPDLIQIMSQGRKTGKLKIVSNQGKGEIHFLSGQIVDALSNGKEGEEAFYALLHISEGYFSVDPKFSPPRTVIRTGTEGLLLEGMRRLDESCR